MDRDIFYFDFTDKLKEFNEKVGDGNQLSATELNSLQTLMEGKDATDVHLNFINKVLSWPTGNVSCIYMADIKDIAALEVCRLMHVQHNLFNSF